MQSLSFTGPVLILEAATTAGSVALLQDGALDVVRLVAMGVGREDQLFPAIQAVLAERGLAAAALCGIVCGAGPGSFTSLRIAAALAKGLAHGAHLPLYAVPSLALAAGALSADAPSGRYVVHSDALRGERYALPVFRDDHGLIQPAGELARVTVEQLSATSSASERIAVGTPIDALASDWHVEPSAGYLRRVGGAWCTAPVSLADWEPDYGRLAEAQVKWEATHGELPASVRKASPA